MTSNPRRLPAPPAPSEPANSAPVRLRSRRGRAARAGAAVAMSVLATVAVLPAADATAQRTGALGGQTSGPVIIAHRGASAYRPEHTLAGYELAVRMGADYIEPDLVLTKDGVLVASHSPEIGSTTDVADHPEFAGRMKTRSLDGWEMTGWFADDFTLAELKTLRCREDEPSIRQHTTIYDGRYQIPTFQEIIDLTRRLSRELGRDVGMYPETKNPTYYRKLGMPIEPKLVRALEANGLNTPRAKVIVQSFEVGNLKELHKRLRVPLIQLLYKDGAPPDFAESGDPRTYADLVTPAGLREIATYAAGIGPDKDMVIGRNPDGTLGQTTNLVRDAHRAGLVVHAYTFRAENDTLPKNFRSSDRDGDYGDLFGELKRFFAAGVDGVFTDNTDIGVAARAER